MKKALKSKNKHSTIELVFIAPPIKYDCFFDQKSQSLTIGNTRSREDKQGKASYVGGNLFCFWFNMNDDGVTKSIDFFYKGNFYNSNDNNLKVTLVHLEDQTVPYKFRFQIFENDTQTISDTYVSQAVNSYLLNVTYDDFDLQEDDILIDFIYYWDNLRLRKV